jgi:two-component system nitrogen regulation response regulator NtrX
VAQGQFREDLYFRLNVFPIHLPPLRERLADLPSLAAHFATRVRPRAPLTFAPDAIAALAGYAWPGNIRELANVVERLSILGGNHVGAEDVLRVLPGAGRTPPAPAPSTPDLALADALDAHERSLIAGALARAEGNVAEAARMLQTDRANLYRRMKRLGLGG